MDTRTFARQWMSTDPDPKTRAATEALLADTDDTALKAAFGTRLRFGTAGMRGPLGPGPNRMNRALVRRVSAGLGLYLHDLSISGPIVVGFDARHGSKAFAADSAQVLVAQGFTVYLYEGLISTPELAHAVKYLKCVAGIMVTASHNPPQDNGYKVYWGNGAQIIPPHDTGISACIDRVDTVVLGDASLILPVPAEVGTVYDAAVQKVRCWHGSTDISIVYTAMHGIGWVPLKRTLENGGYTQIHPVTTQVEPDPDFPTVAFPNPEEPGALDQAIALAKAVHADVVLANDPDADRLAVALPTPDGYRALTGNQIGVLIADELLSHGQWGENPMVATTIVSSQLLSRMAKAAGIHYAETLTGFKWIANAAIEHSGQFVMGYEEAIGFSVGPVVRDKDGLSAALIFTDLVARAKAEGKTVWDRLEALYRTHGLHHSSQQSTKLPGEEGAKQIAAMMEKLRQDPPQTIADIAVTAVRDYAPGIDGLVPSNVLAFSLADGSRILARPSGTEPKIKFYFEVCVTMTKAETLAQAEVRAQASLEALMVGFQS